MNKAPSSKLCYFILNIRVTRTWKKSIIRVYIKLFFLEELNMKFKQNAIYDIVVPTSMGVRITPADRQAVHTSTLFRMQATSAESNVLSSGASFSFG